MKGRRLWLVIVPLVVVMVLLATVSPQANAESNAAQGGETHKVIAAAGALDPNAAGVRLLHDYGSFVLYEVSDGALPGLSSAGEGQVQVVDEMDALLIDAYPFNTQAQSDTPAFAGLERYAPTEASLQLIQFVGPIKVEWLKAVEATGATLVHYIANNGYLVWADGATRNRLATLAAEKEFLQYSGLYQPYFKVAPQLREVVSEAAEKDGKDETIAVVVQMYNHTGKGTSEAAIAAVTERVLSEWSPILKYQNTTVEVRASELATIASLPDVYWIGPKPEFELHDEVQTQIIAGNFDGTRTGPSAPGYLAWLRSYGFSENPADYPIVDVTDDGIGNGTTTTGDPTLHVAGNAANPSRVAFVGNCTTDATGDGVGGHGHLNANIAMGYDERTGAPFQDADGFQRGAGVNPFGRVAGTKIFRNSGPFSISGCGNNDRGVIAASYNGGARISTNSWGASVPTYDTASQVYDAGTRDALAGTAGNQQFITIFSAGNDGSGAATIGSPGNAKNVITVGASENDRATWTDGCAIGPTGADNAMDVADFSSRGPAPGGRVKPEVIAPGTHIQGTASTAAGYDGSGVCDRYRPSGQTVFAASSGTSHSTPAVAGVASLYYWWLENEYGLSTPSPAMMKAYLVAHPTYLTGLDANDTLPSNDQGYGMPNLTMALDETSRKFVDQTEVFNNTGETFTLTTAVADTSKPLRIVMTYTDAPGAVGTSPQVNNLNLEAVVGGTSYLGNQFSGQWSTTGGTADNANNYEAVFLPAGTTGTVTITITAANIAGDGVPNMGDATDQDFALVCYNCATDPSFTVAATPRAQEICAVTGGQVNVNVKEVFGYSGTVALSVDDVPPGMTATLNTNPVTTPGSSVLSLTRINPELVASGLYTLEVEGTDGTLTRSTTFGIQLVKDIPAATTLNSPASGVTNVSTAPALTWTAVTAAKNYTVEIATDPDFTTIVQTASNIVGTSYTPATPLNESTAYYWRVTASNLCGESPESEPSAFVTRFSTTAVPATQVCDLTSVAIPDNNATGVNSDLVAPASFMLGDLNIAITTTHTFVNDLIYTLTHVESGTSVVVINRPRSSSGSSACGQNHIRTTLDDEAADSVVNKCAASTAATPPPYAIDGTFRPVNPLSGFDGESLSGTWRLNVSDRADEDLGTLTGWCMSATPVQAADFSDQTISYGVAWHMGDGTLRLGTLWSSDTTFNSATDNDDGVVDNSPDYRQGGTAGVDVTVSGAGYLAAWYDWNGDGTFDTSTEKVIGEAVTAGTRTFTFSIPADADTTQPIQARFRLYSSEPTVMAPMGTETPAGAAVGGEVEDYAFAPMAVTLAGFTANATESEILLQWETGSEMGNLGFNLLRSTDAEAEGVLLNNALIPSQGPDSSTGFSYDWTDSDLEGNTTYFYWLEAVSRNGQRERFGPVSATLLVPTALTVGTPMANSGSSPALPLLALGMVALAGGLLAIRRRRA